jgi:tetratricopeptide (TPR) repeat protein
MMTPGRSVVCPVLIGRAAQFDALSRLLEQACCGQGAAVLIAGEAGIGKSRLVAEATAIASKQGFQVLRGACFEHDRSLPYAAILDLLRMFLSERSPQETAECLGASGSEIVKLVPELGSLLPGLAPSPPLDPEQEKRRHFHSLAQFFGQLAARQPVLTVFEDLHWSDETTLELLLHLGRRIESHQIVLLMTYRNDELHPALTHFLAEMDRQRLAAELVLGRLTQAEVDVMLRVILDLQRPVRREFLETIYQVTEGNPFFVEEVLKSLVAAGRVKGEAHLEWDRQPVEQLAIPRTIQDAVRRRAAQLSREAQQLLVLAAVAGQRFDFTLLEELTQTSGAELVQQLKEMAAAQLIVEESEERFSFHHALTRQAIHSQLLARERQGLHRDIAETMERLYSDSPEAHLEDLAYHSFEAGLWEKALDYCQRAGDKALALFTPWAAVQHLSRALEAANRLNMSPTSKLWRARGLAYETLGEFEHALADHERALEAARRTGDGKEEWQCLLGLGMLWASRDYAKAGEHYQKALQLAQAVGDQTLLAHSLNRVGNWRLNTEQPDEALHCHTEALRILDRTGDKASLAGTLDLLGMAWLLASDAVKSKSHYEWAVRLFQELDDRQGLVSSLATMAVCGGVYHTGTIVPAITLPASTSLAERALGLARDIGWRSGESYALWNLAMCLGAQGEYGRALDCAQSGYEIAAEIDHLQWMSAACLCLGALHLDLFALPEPRQHFEQALTLAKQTGSLHWTRTATGFLASTCIQQEELALAESLLETALEVDTPAQTMGQRTIWRARVELALARGDPLRALQIGDMLIESAPNVGGGRIVPLLWKLRGDALALLGRPAEAESALRAAIEAARAQYARALLWRVHVALGNLYRKQERLEDADEEHSAARAIVEELAATVTDERLHENFLRRAQAFLPPTRWPTARQAAKQQFGGLTARERDVATLVAQGKSNRAIADALVLSERTVESHVSNILAKLGFSARTQIAAWAVEKGLANQIQ